MNQLMLSTLNCRCKYFAWRKGKSIYTVKCVRNGLITLTVASSSCWTVPLHRCVMTLSPLINFDLNCTFSENSIEESAFISTQFHGMLHPVLSFSAYMLPLWWIASSVDNIWVGLVSYSKLTALFIVELYPLT